VTEGTAMAPWNGPKNKQVQFSNFKSPVLAETVPGPVMMNGDEMCLQWVVVIN